MIPSRVSGRGYKIGPVRLCVCVCVCSSVSTLMAEPFDIRAQNLASTIICIISRMSLMIRVIGQRSRSPGQKTLFF